MFWMIIRALKATILHTLRALLYGLAGGLLVLIVAAVFELNSRPDLKVWHTAELDEEFTADSGIENFDQYLELEDRLFKQLDEEVYQKIGPQDRRVVNRYNPDGFTSPGRAEVNWNRSFEWKQDQPRLGVVLLHGLSDSPYSLRSIGKALHEQGAWVLGLRVPGHGQAPSGLVDVRWEDMAAAVEIAVRRVHDQVPDQPLYIVGYSNGGALAVHYTLKALSEPGLPMPSGLVLMSPEIGISKLAALAAWQERLGHVLGLEKLAWTDVLPEYDPWKYNSFPTNAAKQAHLITKEIQKQLDRLSSGDLLERMPTILAFQSAVDATVTAEALVGNLFMRLPAPQNTAGPAGLPWNELVLFDLNRRAEIEPLLGRDPLSWMQPMLHNHALTFRLTLLTNRGDEDPDLAAVMRTPGSDTQKVCDTGLQWPPAIYSLSHVALPFPPDDLYYGGHSPGSEPAEKLGRLAFRGERNTLLLTPDAMLRLRWNPFHEYMMQRISAFTGLAPPAAESCETFSLPAGQ